MKTVIKFVLVVTAACATAKSANAQGLKLGVAAVESGDDVMRPAANLRLDYTEKYSSRVLFYGRDYGPVSERTVMASFERNWSFSSMKRLRAAVGVGGLLDRKEIYANVEGVEVIRDDQYNIGGTLGLNWNLLPYSSALQVTLDWHSHIYPAGVGGILLAHARSQVFGISIGVNHD